MTGPMKEERCLTMAQACETLRVSRRWMQDFLKAHPEIRVMRAGRHYRFDESDIRAIKEAMRCRSSSPGAAGRKTGTSAAPSEARLYSRAQELLTAPSRNRSGSGAKAKSNTVVSMAPRRQRRS
ncbi:hypothetical protein CVT23_09145 [Minwuia thermotolerans]|uniref:Helix-turn-helix domain-containing protein n=1 Tax=Minwuia thermotolerans TaxID=2056226 RepID=A0A2M9G2J8_9PROT|nr:hypothetical protein CVT23_09145 [Minwuia thermotolerans]